MVPYCSGPMPKTHVSARVSTDGLGDADCHTGWSDTRLGKQGNFGCALLGFLLGKTKAWQERNHGSLR